MQTQTLNLRGMSCEACVGHVKRALEGLEGVQSVRVSLADGQAKVVYDPAQVGPVQMVEAISEEGYEATPR